MDKNAIKKYAVWARRELISRVSGRAAWYGITKDSCVDADADSIDGRILSATEKKQRAAFITKVQREGYEQAVEEIAYTWFNRFCALRYMEVNGYLPSHIRVFTDDANEFKPQILDEAIHFEIEGLDKEKVLTYKDINDTEGLYRYLLITQCNALSSILPGIFQKIEDYTELLLPENLLRDGSVIERMIVEIPEEDWTDQVQIIGWLYQYYNAEKKDEVFATLKNNVKITKENIPATTQLFTPDWIVRYMVENSLGRLWIEGHPNDDLKSSWEYYLDEAKQEPKDNEQLAEIQKKYAELNPENIKCIDPCCGSGHILVYMFDVLMQIYKSYGYSTQEAVSSIVTNNLYGLDIDERATQLAYFAVMMKARNFDSRFFSRKIQPHIYVICESNNIDKNLLDYFTGDNPKLKKDLGILVAELHNAKEFGSLLNITSVNFDCMYERIEDIKNDINFYTQAVMDVILPLIQVSEVLSQKYNVVVTNPPYMKSDNMSTELSNYVINQHKDAKYDLYSIFIYRCYDFMDALSFMAMITMHNFMFSPSFQNFRKNIVKWDWVNMVHLGSRAFDEISGEVVQTTAFVLKRTSNNTYLSVVDTTDGKSEKEKENIFLKSKKTPYLFNILKTELIPGNAFGYALSDTIINYYQSNDLICNYGISKAGIVTGNDDYFIKFWYEVNFKEISLHPITGNLYKYVLFSRGGTFNKWYGNSQHVLKLKDLWDDNKVNVSVRRGDPDFYFQTGIGWSQMGGGVNKSYSLIENSICKTTTPMFYPDNNKLLKYMLAYLNSSIPPVILKALNPTLSILTSDITNLPFVYDSNYLNEIDSLVDENIQIMKKWYDSCETHWQFSHNLLLENHCLKNTCENLCSEVNTSMKKIFENQNKINYIFSDLTGLTTEANDSNDITMPVSSSALYWIKSLVSYAVGSMFGRYSLDVDGLAYAGGEWDASKYETYQPDHDGILPICDDEYFTDDIVGRFVDFIRTVYGPDTLEENLQFIADALGGKGSSREVIRKYFLNNFFADHCKIYQKRPIYWLFDSGKKNGFKCLIYLHRYRPDTIARIRTDYVHEQQARYRTAIADLENRIETASTSDRIKLNKELKKVQEQAEELHDYEEKIHHLADQYIDIDLDDGVKVNYAKFQDVLAKIK